MLRRTDLQKVAEGKIADAQLLLAYERFSGAYYMAGYAVEIGLKACAARQIDREAIPDRSFLQGVYTHNLDQLVQLAGLKARLRDRQSVDRKFQANWGIVAEWRPESRYELVDPMSAGLLVDAVVNDESGVLGWIRTFW